MPSNMHPLRWFIIISANADNQNCHVIASFNAYIFNWHHQAANFRLCIVPNIHLYLNDVLF